MIVDDMNKETQAYNKIKYFVDNAVNEKPIEQLVEKRTSIDDLVKTSMLDFLKILMSHGSFDLRIQYTSSRNGEYCEGDDYIDYDGKSGLMKVVHAPDYFIGKIVQKEFIWTPEEYVGNLIFPENITFLEVLSFQPEKSERSGFVMINVETIYKTKGMVELPGGSYVTVAEIVPRLRLVYEQ